MCSCDLVSQTSVSRPNALHRLYLCQVYTNECQLSAGHGTSHQASLWELKVMLPANSVTISFFINDCRSL